MNHGGRQTDAGILELIRNRLNIDVMDVDTDLIETGSVDSLALVMLISALEETFACELPLDDFDIDNFRSARRITEYLNDSGVVPGRNAS
jgi:acyl carrier protein